MKTREVKGRIQVQVYMSVFMMFYEYGYKLEEAQWFQVVMIPRHRKAQRPHAG